jgi:hypothetical protein
LLHLLEGLAGIDALMLAGISDEENAVLRPDLLHESLHLASAGETGFIDHIKVSSIGIALHLVLTAACEKALQRLCGDASVPELGCGATGWGTY